MVSDAARSWGGSAVLGVSPMSDCRGSPHSRFASRRDVTDGVHLVCSEICSLADS
ncbi:MAG: hypothetical protein F6K55_20070 [Moorea sp. SIO4A3]|nr:hypothetical protein [Moorena sp. SIO4A3]